MRTPLVFALDLIVTIGLVILMASGYSRSLIDYEQAPVIRTYWSDGQVRRAVLGLVADHMGFLAKPRGSAVHTEWSCYWLDYTVRCLITRLGKDREFIGSQWVDCAVEPPDKLWQARCHGTRDSRSPEDTTGPIVLRGGSGG